MDKEIPNRGTELCLRVCARGDDDVNILKGKRYLDEFYFIFHIKHSVPIGCFWLIFLKKTKMGLKNASLSF